MTDELSEYLEELGFARKPERRKGLDRAMSAFLGRHLERKTPIQEQAIEVIYDGADVLLVSATASGKTEAALVPVAARLLAEPEKVALYIAPTRALLNDLYARMEAPLFQLGLDASIRHGDHALPTRADSIRVLFTTPESLDVLLSKRTQLLERVRWAILDEIHQVFGAPRGDQLGFLLQRLEHLVGERIQRIALSATVGDPDGIAVWLCPQREPARVIGVAARRTIRAKLRWLPSLACLHDLIWEHNPEKALCFVNSRSKCEDVYLILRQLKDYQAFVHYSTLTAEHRESVERGFKSAQRAVCVATSTLELGIDIGSIQEVVLVDAPNSVGSFLQRIGRGGRRGDYSSVSLTPQNPLNLLQLAAALRQAEEGKVEAATAGHPYSVLLQQLFSILASRRRLCIHPDDLIEQFGALGWLGIDSIHAIVSKLATEGFLRREGSGQVYEIGPNLEELLDEGRIYTNILDGGSGIPMSYKGRLLARLPLQRGQIKHGNVILFAGRFWRIIGISAQGLTVDDTAPIPNPIRPVWNTQGIFAASSTLSQGMRALLLERPDLAGHELDEECRRQLDALYARSAELEQRRDAIWCESLGARYVYYTFAGATENRILQMIFEANGASCEPALRAEGLALVSNERLDFGCIPDNRIEVAEMITSGWRSFGSQVNKGTFYDYLPANLKRDETVAQVDVPAIIAGVVALSKASVAPARLQLVA